MRGQSLLRDTGTVTYQAGRSQQEPPVNCISQGVLARSSESLAGHAQLPEASLDHVPAQLLSSKLAAALTRPRGARPRPALPHGSQGHLPGPAPQSVLPSTQLSSCRNNPFLSQLSAPGSQVPGYFLYFDLSQKSFVGTQLVGGRTPIYTERCWFSKRRASCGWLSTACWAGS